MVSARSAAARNPSTSMMSSDGAPRAKEIVEAGTAMPRSVSPDRELRTPTTGPALASLATTGGAPENWTPAHLSIPAGPAGASLCGGGSRTQVRLRRAVRHREAGGHAIGRVGDGDVETIAGGERHRGARVRAGPARRSGGTRPCGACGGAASGLAEGD